MLRFAFDCSGYLLGLPLELLVIGAMLRGGWRRFPLVFAYAVAYFLTSVIEAPLFWASYAPWSPDAKNPWIRSSLELWYWRDETVLQILVFAVVGSLVWEATAGAPSRRALRALLIGFGILFAGVSFLVHFAPGPNVKVGLRMTRWARDLNFSSAILDMAVWVRLLGSRRRDRSLLLLIGGLGVEFAGEAIAESLRGMSPATEMAGSCLNMFTNLLFLYIWWQTFRAPRAPRKPQELDAAEAPVGTHPRHSNV